MYDDFICEKFKNILKKEDRHFDVVRTVDDNLLVTYKSSKSDNKDCYTFLLDSNLEITDNCNLNINSLKDMTKFEKKLLNVLNYCINKTRDLYNFDHKNTVQKTLISLFFEPIYHDIVKDGIFDICSLDRRIALTYNLEPQYTIHIPCIDDKDSVNSLPFSDINEFKDYMYKEFYDMLSDLQNSQALYKYQYGDIEKDFEHLMTIAENTLTDSFARRRDDIMKKLYDSLRSSDSDIQCEYIEDGFESWMYGSHIICRCDYGSVGIFVDRDIDRCVHQGNLHEKATVRMFVSDERSVYWRLDVIYLNEEVRDEVSRLLYLDNELENDMVL